MSRAKRLLAMKEERIQCKSPEEIVKANNAIFLTGNAPRGGAIVREYAISPTGIDFYSKEAADICAAYDAMPTYDSSASELWEKLGEVRTLLCRAGRHAFKGLSDYPVRRCRPLQVLRRDVCGHCTGCV